MIATDRLVLRRWHDGDRAPFAAMGQDAEVMRYFPSLLTAAQSDALVDRIEASIDAKGYGLWALERRSDHVFIGFTGLADIGFASPIEGDVEIGWRLRRDAWGHGYATEAAHAALAWGLANLGCARIVSMTATTNHPSQAVMARIGMVRRPELDFDHPRLPDGSPLKRHVVWVAERGHWTAGRNGLG